MNYTSLTDVPFAVTNAELLAELGWNVLDTERDINERFFSESVMRKLIAKYNSEEWISFYNDYVQKQVLETMQLQPSIHILDCTKIPVNLKNEHYEESTVVKIDGETMRGYKLGVLRGVLDNSSPVEEIVFGTLKTYDLELTRELLKTSSCLKEQDILINDRGFLSRELLNYLKTTRKVDSYLPAKENMILFQDAVQLANNTNHWQKHPNQKRKEQEIQLVTDLGSLWESENPQEDVPINACVWVAARLPFRKAEQLLWNCQEVHDKKTDHYFVFMTTDTSKTA